MRILCAVDGSRFSNWALDFVSKMPLAVPSRITVLHVVDLAALTRPTFLAPSLAVHYSRLMEEEVRKSVQSGERLVHRASESLRGRWKHVRAVLERGHVAERIIARAESEKADLIIVGSRGVRNLSGFLLGSVSQKVATYARCSVLIVKRPVKRIREVLLAVDGSAHSEYAVAFLNRHFLPKGLRVDLIYVWDYPFSLPASRSLRLQKKLGEGLRRAGFRPAFFSQAGQAADQIVKMANRKHVDLMIVGSRGLTRAKRYLLGSVSLRVKKHARASVLIVRRGRANRPHSSRTPESRHKLGEKPWQQS